MLIFLLFLSVGLFFVHSHTVHLLVMGLHLAWYLFTGYKLFNRQPITALFTFAYVAMYFPNPLAIGLGLMPLEPGTTQEVFFQANSLMLCGATLFLIAATYLRSNKQELRDMPVIQLDVAAVNRVTLLLCGFLFVMTCYVIFGMAAFGVNVFTVEKSFLNLAGPQRFFYPLTNKSYVVIPLVGFLIGVRKIREQVPFLIGVAFLLLLHLMIFRTRTQSITFLVGYGFGYLAKYRYVMLFGQIYRGKIPMWVAPAVMVALPTLLFIGVGLKYLRYSHHLEDMRYDQSRVEYIMNHTFSGGDLGYTIFLRHAISLYPSQEPYLDGQSYYRLLFTPIPRSIWNEKPENTQRIFAIALDPELGKRGATVPPGIVGDLYINFGVFGVAGMLVYGLIFRQEQYRGIVMLLFASGSVGWIFHFVRGGLTNPLTWVVVVSLTALFIRHRLRPTYYSRHQQPGYNPAVPGAY